MGKYESEWSIRGLLLDYCNPVVSFDCIWDDMIMTSQNAGLWLVQKLSWLCGQGQTSKLFFAKLPAIV